MIKSILALIFIALLAGCSGGGGSSDPETVTIKESAIEQHEYTTAIIGDSNCISTEIVESYPDQLGWLNLCIFDQRANEVDSVPVADRIVLAIGFNDVTYGVKRGLSDHDQGLAAYEKLIIAAYNNGSDIICILPPRTLRKEFHQAVDLLNADLTALCFNYGARVINTPELFTKDGVHINQEAHDQIVTALYPQR